MDIPQIYCVDTLGPTGINDCTHLHHIYPVLNKGAHPCCQMHQPMALLLFCNKNIRKITYIGCYKSRVTMQSIFTKDYGD